jgi:hypothetical protein
VLNLADVDPSTVRTRPPLNVISGNTSNTATGLPSADGKGRRIDDANPYQLPTQSATSSSISLFVSRSLTEKGSTSKPAVGASRSRWTASEDAILIDGRRKGLSYEQILPSLPGRRSAQNLRRPFATLPAIEEAHLDLDIDAPTTARQIATPVACSPNEGTILVDGMQARM